MKRWNLSLRKKTATCFQNQDIINKAIDNWFPELYMTLEQNPQIEFLFNADETRITLDLFHEKTIEFKENKYFPFRLKIKIERHGQLCLVDLAMGIRYRLLFYSMVKNKTFFET